ncbi:MAG: hypothetical protein J0I09_00035 [Sphingobacteriia bacterium]|nr:hypothetical protein [Sphingobacteriia bacterium]
MTKNSAWVSNPTKRQMILTNVVWLTGVILMTLAMPKFFNESVFKSKNLMLFLLITIATITEIIVTRNFFKNQNTDK